jgi:hypothetical protein
LSRPDVTRGRSSLTGPVGSDAAVTGKRGPAGGFVGPDGNTAIMAKYLVNTAAVTHCRKLIDAHQYVVSSDWGEVQPAAEQQNDYLRNHSWSDYALWHLGLTSEAADETKARYAFIYGDLHRVHRSGLIACVYRAAEWEHKDVELAAHELLQHLDRVRA